MTMMFFPDLSSLNRRTASFFCLALSFPEKKSMLSMPNISASCWRGIRRSIVFSHSRSGAYFVLIPAISASRFSRLLRSYSPIAKFTAASKMRRNGGRSGSLVSTRRWKTTIFLPRSRCSRIRGAIRLTFILSKSALEYT